MDHLQQRWIGTGHADLSRWEWAVHQQRDSYTTYISRASLLDYFAIAHGQTRQRVRYEFIKKMVKPVANQPLTPQQTLIAQQQTQQQTTAQTRAQSAAAAV